MYKSWNDNGTRAEWDDVLKERHVAAVREAIKSRFIGYLDKALKPVVPAGNDLRDRLAAYGTFKVTGPKKPESENRPDPSRFVDALSTYEKEALRYRDFFNTEKLELFRLDDPDAFKTALSREAPVIRKILQSKRGELKEWRIKYNSNTSSEELLAVFEELIGFSDGYFKEFGEEGKYAALSSHDDFKFDAYAEDEIGIPGVIGGGIKSRVLFHLHPRIFPERSGLSLYALFFLTGKSHFRLRSQTSEFLMIDDSKEGLDVNIKMDHNYWYSYRLFTSYALMLATMIEAEFRARGLHFDVEHRYVYLDAFFQFICSCHEQEVRDMRGNDELGEQYRS
jgi:hypothetical protein